MSGQAVGGAVAHNPISLIIPCHRVVGSSGSLTGYAGGMEKKIYLLTLEKVDRTSLFGSPKGNRTIKESFKAERAANQPLAALSSVYRPPLKASL